MTQALWSKESSTTQTELQKTITHFMSGGDVILDRELMLYDIQASLAHVQGLQRIGVIGDEELTQITTALAELTEQFKSGDFVLDSRFEDCHSAIEWFLTQKLGDVGKKVHTGRSRNDQVAVATRLYCREALDALASHCQQIGKTCLELAKKHEYDVLPGYTHLQRAVVSSWGMWFASFAESFCDNAYDAKNTYELINSNPLGTAAGYGVNLKLDRDYTTEALGFNRKQVNPIYAQNSRGKIELQVLGSFKNALLDIRRMAWDLSLFSTAEYDFVTVGNDFCTGSSIMPNKHNPDAIELMRAEYSRLVGAYNEIESLLSLPSGYQRDLQSTKGALLRGVSSAQMCLELVPALLKTLVINTDKCEAAIDASMFATDKAVELVIEDGMVFRDAYRHIKYNYQELENRKAIHSLKKRVSPGAAGNLFLSEIEGRLVALS
ncbi:argininosuccinate lyase [Kangiella spongicola]|uniref:Argininosuccinate lyase n=1 Tax=Kangiella spongicola TaxID=796379 RepID=A0A318D6C7_9GAMM|nr:argininosuccinate lyase [Kangiella spongicola]PXF63425.1 argininosuccinate lyase [Kangiella spongicola]